MRHLLIHFPAFKATRAMIVLRSLWGGWLWSFFTAGISRSCTRNCRMCIATVGSVLAFLGCNRLPHLDCSWLFYLLLCKPRSSRNIRVHGAGVGGWRVGSTTCGVSTRCAPSLGVVVVYSAWCALSEGALCIAGVVSENKLSTTFQYSKYGLLLEQYIHE